MWFLWLRRIIKAFKLYFCSYKQVFSVVSRFHAHIVVATVAVATTGPAVSTLFRESL